MSVYTANEIRETHTDRPSPTGRWIPARPINFRYDPWLTRAKLAWGVLIGKYDALNWQEGKQL